MSFQCCRCATCCTHLRGHLSYEDKRFVEEFYYGKLPIVWLIPLDQMTFPIMPWEAKRLRTLRPDIELKPLRIIFDLNSNRAIIVAYFLDAEVCPFLHNNECTVYLQRPYVCQQFPIQHIDLKDNNIIVSDICKQVDEAIPQADMPAYFGKTYANALEHARAVEWFNETVLELLKNNCVRPALHYPYPFLMKRYEHATKIDFLDFLKEKKIPAYPAEQQP